jgi:hypothetical protein
MRRQVVNEGQSRLSEAQAGDEKFVPENSPPVYELQRLTPGNLLYRLYSLTSDLRTCCR